MNLLNNQNLKSSENLNQSTRNLNNENNKYFFKKRNQSVKLMNSNLKLALQEKTLL